VNYFLDFLFLCRPVWGNTIVSAFAHVLIVGGGAVFLQENIWGNGVPHPGNGVPHPLHHCYVQWQ